MKHTKAFKDFLTNTVNLNQSRISILEERVKTVTELLHNSDLLKDHFLDHKAQGSWATKTIIKPLPNNEFDADVRIYLSSIPKWEPKDYINNLYTFFKKHGTYENMISRKTRCLTLNYAGDFHLDIVPCLNINDKYWVFNKNENLKEATDGNGYTEWFKEQNKIVGNNNLIKVVRVVKYLRNIKKTFTAKSVLLTTLIANQVQQSTAEDFTDLPTSLWIISNNLNDFLQANPSMPIIRNPALYDEDFNRHWDQKKYGNFRDMWQGYTTKLNDAFEEKNQNESIKKWRLLFGNNFGTLKESNQINKTTAPPHPWADI